MSTVPVSPSANVALRMLAALGITDRTQAREALIQWCRPSPRLSVADVRRIMAEFPATEVPAQWSREEPDLAVPPGVEGYGISGRDFNGEQER